MHMNRAMVNALGRGMCCLGLLSQAMLTAGPSAKPLTALHQFNASMDQLVRKTSPSVVQILVTCYGPIERKGSDEVGMMVGRERAIGSGFVMDSEGYIITNAHVVKDAQTIQVMLPRPNDHTIEASISSKNRVMSARLVGASEALDLALLKVDNLPLPPLKLGAYQNVHQGELVFAFGSPEGLRNSVTMGVVSNPARQTEPDSAMVYIQTDASINPGNSGGPLVNVDGEVVGVNTFIMTESGGNEGLGFAIPSTLVDVFYQQVKKTGQLRRAEIGINVQTINPIMAQALKLPQDFGVIVSDVTPGGSAALAGVQAGDVILSIDTKPVESLPFVAFHLVTRKVSDTVELRLFRAGKELTLKVPVVEPANASEKNPLAMPNPETNTLPTLGILGIAIDKSNEASFEGLRETYGIVVAARIAKSDVEVPLRTGDVIHAINGKLVCTLDALKARLTELPKGASVVLQIERDRKFLFLAFSLD